MPPCFGQGKKVTFSMKSYLSKMLSENKFQGLLKKKVGSPYSILQFLLPHIFFPLKGQSFASQKINMTEKCDLLLGRAQTISFAGAKSSIRIEKRWTVGTNLSTLLS